MTYSQLKEAINKIVHEYDRDLFYRDIDYRKMQEPKIRECSEKQESLRLQYREENPVISPVDENEMVADLGHKKYRVTVAFQLSRMPAFSEGLLLAMLKAAVYETDPSANRIFLEPCTRVYDVFVVNDIILDYIANGTKAEKIGALRAFYWVRSKIVQHSKGMGPIIEDLIEYRWNGKSYDYYDSNYNYFALSAAALNEYKPRVESMRSHRREFILGRLAIESDIDILFALFKELPKTPEEFPENLQSRAKVLFDLNEREMLMGIYDPYRKLEGVADKDLRLKIFEQQKVVVEEQKEKVQTAILKKKKRF